MYVDLDNESPLVVDYLTSPDKTQEIAERYGLKSGTALKERVKKEKNFEFVELSSSTVARDLASESKHARMFYRLVGNKPNVVTQKLYDLFLSEEYMVDAYRERGLTPDEIAEELDFPFLDGKQIARRVEKLHLKHKEGTMSDIAKRNWKDKDSRLEKTRTSNLNKWGVPYTTQSEEMKSKTRQTMLSRYGVEHALQVDEFKKKARDTNLDRYGVEHASQSISLRARNVSWHETKYVKSSEEALELLAPDEKGVSVKLLELLRSLVDSGEYENFTFDIISNDVLGLNKWYFHNLPYNVEIDGKLIVSNYRGEQNEVVDYILGLVDTPVKRDGFYESMGGKQLDIYLPEYNFAIEFNGTFWHATDGDRLPSAKPSSYHAEKTRLARQAGINLIHIWEYDWKNPVKREVIKSQIKYHLNKSETQYYARKLVVKAVEAKGERVFLNNNHIQGYVASSEKYGLYDGDELISLMTFGKRRFDNNEGWELLRFATKLDTYVAGGASRLLKHFARNHPGDTLISYANNDFAYSGSKSLYSNLGFKYVKTTVPGYKWANTRGDVVSRYKVQVHKLKAFSNGEISEPFPYASKDFSDEDTETTYMTRNWYYKVYDAGNDLYRKVL